MKFNCDRNKFKTYISNLAKIAPKEHAMDIMTGILLESDTEKGEIYMTASNASMAIKFRMRGAVEKSGSTVINAELLKNMVDLWNSERIYFTADKQGNAESVTIINGTNNSRFRILTQSASLYINVPMPIPEDTAKFTGLCTLASQTTYMANKKNQHNPALECVYIRLGDAGTSASASDNSGMVIAKNSMVYAEDKEFLIPATVLNLLSSMSTDEDIYDVGEAGGKLVFCKRDMIFTASLVKGKPISPDIVKHIVPKYMAVVDSEKLYHAVDLMKPIAETRKINLLLDVNRVSVKYHEDNGKFETSIVAETHGVSEAIGFYYPIKELSDFLRNTEGKVRIGMDPSGMLLFLTKQETIFFVSPMSNIKKGQKNEKKPKVTKDAA